MADNKSNVIFKVVLIIVAAFILFALINYYNSKQATVKTEKFYQATMQPSFPQSSEEVKKDVKEAFLFDNANTADKGAKVSKPTNDVQPADPDQNEDYRTVDFKGNKLPNDCFPKDRLTADDLLPKDAANTKWAQVNPAGQGDVKDQNFLSAGYMIGINTVGSSLKNPNLQLRSEPVIPKVSVGPFLNSTYEASDILRRPLEIGGDC
jgi:hypothetical protein